MGALIPWHKTNLRLKELLTPQAKLAVINRWQFENSSPAMVVHATNLKTLAEVKAERWALPDLIGCNFSDDWVYSVSEEDFNNLRNQEEELAVDAMFIYTDAEQTMPANALVSAAHFKWSDQEARARWLKVVRFLRTRFENEN